MSLPMSGKGSRTRPDTSRTGGNRSMYDPNELIQEFKTCTPLEKAALECGETDSSLIAERLGIIDYQLDQSMRKTLSKEYYFPTGDGITYSKHPRFVDCAPHRHDFFEFTYVWQGGVWQTVNNSRIHIGEGDLLLLDTNVRHSLERVGEDTFAVNIMMTEEYFHETLMKQFSCSNRITEFIFSALYRHRLSGNYLYFPLENNAEIRHCITAVLMELKHNEPGSGEIINSFMTILFSLLARKGNCQDAGLSGSGTASASVVSILDYMSRNYMDLTLEKTAEAFHFSPNYLSRLLKKYTGKTFISIILELKLERSAMLLKNTSLPITKAAASSGFQNMNYFYKLFREKYGCTPKQFRTAQDSSIPSI